MIKDEEKRVEELLCRGASFFEASLERRARARRKGFRLSLAILIFLRMRCARFFSALRGRERV